MQTGPADSGTPSPRLADRQLERLIARAREDFAVLAVVLFGSAARGEAMSASDVDVCLVLDPDAAGEPERDARRGAAPGRPRVLLSKDDDRLYELAIRTAKGFEDFKPIYRRYLEAVLDDRPLTQ
jgi:predicted nucleotidyltransferase